MWHVTAQRSRSTPIQDRHDNPDPGRLMPRLSLSKSKGSAMSTAEYHRKLDELDRLLNDPDVPMQPDRIWSLLADVSKPEIGASRSMPPRASWKRRRPGTRRRSRALLHLDAPAAAKSDAAVKAFGFIHLGQAVHCACQDALATQPDFSHRTVLMCWSAGMFSALIAGVCRQWPDPKPNTCFLYSAPCSMPCLVVSSDATETRRQDTGLRRSIQSQSFNLDRV